MHGRRHITEIRRADVHDSFGGSCEECPWWIVKLCISSNVTFKVSTVIFFILLILVFSIKFSSYGEGRCLVLFIRLISVWLYCILNRLTLSLNSTPFSFVYLTWWKYTVDHSNCKQFKRNRKKHWSCQWLQLKLMLIIDSNQTSQNTSQHHITKTIERTQ